MIFIKNGVRLISIVTMDKGENKLTVVKLADEATFDVNEFMLNKEQNPNELKILARYLCELSIEGRYGIVKLMTAK